MKSLCFSDTISVSNFFMSSQKLTKIIATIGPSSESEEMIKKLIHEGVNCFRFNTKHNEIIWHEQTIEKVKKLSRAMGVGIATLLDLQGPSVRLVLPTSDPIIVANGDELELVTDLKKIIKKGFSLTYPEIIKFFKDDTRILVDDGELEFFVKRNKSGQVLLKATRSGEIKPNKSVNIPDGDFPLPLLTPRDEKMLEIIKKGNVDWVGISFVRCADDLVQVRKKLKSIGINPDSVKLMAKIETAQALTALSEIIAVSDAVMVARGDLGVEASLEQVPYYQKKMINYARNMGKPVVTATQMLQSMIFSPTPTRAEVSDVANAIYDKTDAVMLSAESASGKYPLQAVKSLTKIALYNEKLRLANETKVQIEHEDNEVMVGSAAIAMYEHLSTTSQEFGGFVVFTRSGRTARLVAAHRPQVPIFTFASTLQVAEMLSIVFGIQAFEDDVLNCEIGERVTSDDVKRSLEFLVKKNFIKKGQTLVVLHGDIWNEKGGTNTVKIVEA